MSFKRFVRDYLNFTTREKIGIVGLLVLIALFYLLPDLLYAKKDYSAQLKAFEKEIARMDSGNFSTPNEGSGHEKENTTAVFQPFNFDPNTVEPQQLEKFGIPQYIIDRFSKYRNAGAKFYKKEDLKKLYGLSSELYVKMDPYIIIQIKEETQEKKDPRYRPFENNKKVAVNVELNSADSMDLVNVNGIGPYLASKIMKYRRALGGFVSISQLYEIYNVTPEQIDAFKAHVHVTSELITRININSAGYDQLNRHPYISSKEANAIIQYRKQHGMYTSKSDLDKVILLNKQTIENIFPYLSF